MEPKEAPGKESMGTKKRNLTFLRPRLYMLERRKTDTVVESSASGDHSGSLRRSQSDRTEYNQKLQGNQQEINCPRLLHSQLCFSYFSICKEITFRQRRKSNITSYIRKTNFFKLKNQKMKVNVSHKL